MLGDQCAAPPVAVLTAPPATEDDLLGSNTATLVDHIAHVVGCRPKPEMIGAHASWYIAVMQHIQPFRDWSMVQFPGCAMGHHDERVTASRTNFPVPAVVMCGDPEPAGVGSPHLGPEAVCQTDAPVGTLGPHWMGPMVRQIAHGLAFNPAAPCHCLWRRIGRLTTAALAQTRGDGSSIEVHQKLHSGAVGRAVCSGAALSRGPGLYPKGDSA